jgi:hypothetical protein
MAKLALSFILSKVKGNKWQTFPGIGAPIPRVEVQLSSLHVSCEACLSVCLYVAKRGSGGKRKELSPPDNDCLPRKWQGR